MNQHQTSVKPTLIRTRIRRLRQTLDEFHEFEAAIGRYTDWPQVAGFPGMPLFMFKIVARLVRTLSIMLDAVLRPLPFWPVNAVSHVFAGQHD